MALIMKALVIFTILIPLTWSSALPEGSSSSHIGTRIFYGEKALPGQFPWMVAVYALQSGGNNVYGGVLLSERWVLTSASCVQYTTLFRIQLGSNTLIFEDGNRVSVTTRYGVAHPSFNSDYHWHDIGLIRLEGPVQFTRYIQTIGIYSPQIEPNTTVTLLSWGTTKEYGGISNYLNHAEFTTIDNESCNDIYGDVLSASMCAVGSYGINPCGDDEGGPAVILDEDGNPFVVGVFNYQQWTLNCETENDNPLIFSRAGYYLDWIRNVTHIAF